MPSKSIPNLPRPSSLLRTLLRIAAQPESLFPHQIHVRSNSPNLLLKPQILHLLLPNLELLLVLAAIEIQLEVVVELLCVAKTQPEAVAVAGAHAGTVHRTAAEDVLPKILEDAARDVV